MKLINHIYTSSDNLNHFIAANLPQSDQILIQIFTGIIDPILVQSIITTLKTTLPHASIIGATTAGEIADGKITDKQIIISFSLFEHTHIQTYYCGKLDFEHGQEVAKEILTVDTKACILLAEGLKGDSESFLEGFKSQNNDVILAGGNAGDDLTFSNTFIIHNDTVHESGVVIAVLRSEHLHVHNDYSLNWTCVGKEMIVTKSDKNVIYEIDHIPVKKLYKHYLGHEIIENLPTSAIEFPFIKLEQGMRIARSIIGITDDEGFIYAGHFSNGDRVRFAVGNLDEILHRALEIHKSISSKPVEATYVYSCSVRKLFLKEQLDYEMGLIGDIAPTAGFFTYGEFYHSHFGNRLLNITTTTLSLSETDTLNPTHIHPIKPQPHSMLKSLTHLVNVTQDELNHTIHELKTKELTIERQVLDPLCGLLNRTAMNMELDERTGNTTLILFNIDRFSVINDYYGYALGDKLLMAFAKRLSATVDHAYIYRLNSDEFAIICDLPFNSSLYHHLLDHIEKLENYTYNVDGYDLHITISSGTAHGNKHEIYNLAHLALKEAKEQKSKLIVFNDDPSIADKAQNNLQMIDQIKTAIQKDNILPYFQGIVDNKTKKIVKYESLIRMKGDNGKIISPFYFLDHAKKAKFYDQLTQIMLVKTFDIFEAHPMEFSINFTLLDILCKDTCNLLYSLLDKSDNAHNVVIEIVESEGIENFTEVQEFIKTIKRYGAKVAIDDFGSGYSNFAYISKLDIDYLKIDGSIVCDIDTNPDNLFNVESICAIAHRKGIKVIAEFVEKEAIFEKLVELGVDYSQGYLFSKPESYVVQK